MTETLSVERGRREPAGVEVCELVAWLVVTDVLGTGEQFPVEADFATTCD